MRENGPGSAGVPPAREARFWTTAGETPALPGANTFATKRLIRRSQKSCLPFLHSNAAVRRFHETNRAHTCNYRRGWMLVVAAAEDRAHAAAGVVRTVVRVRDGLLAGRCHP